MVVADRHTQDMTRKRYRNRIISHWQGLGMRDLAADWKKWNSAERLLAVILVLMLIGLPLRVLIAGAPL
jgi:hypothetical protein